MNPLETYAWYAQTKQRTTLSCVHYSDVIMGVMASQITGASSVCSVVCSGADQRKHQSPVSLAFVREIHRWTVDSPHKGRLTKTVNVSILWHHHVRVFEGGAAKHHSYCLERRCFKVKRFGICRMLTISCMSVITSASRAKHCISR